MDQSIRLRRPEDGPSPYCMKSAHPNSSGPESAPHVGHSERERKLVALPDRKRFGQRPSQVNLSADGA